VISLGGQRAGVDITLAAKSRVLRAAPDRFEVWDARAKEHGLSFNAWAVATLDASAESHPAVVPHQRSGNGRTPEVECPRARFHRPGTFCKEEGCDFAG
jgi:hypothetical protein